MSNGDTFVHVKSEGILHLKLALDLATRYHSGGKTQEASHWLVHENSIIFAGHENSKGIPLPSKMGIDGMAGAIMSWLETAEYGRQPDHDGDNNKGWELKSHFRLMPQIEGRFYFMFSVQPHWVAYHK